MILLTILGFYTQCFYRANCYLLMMPNKSCHSITVNTMYSYMLLPVSYQLDYMHFHHLNPFTIHYHFMFCDPYQPIIYRFYFIC